MIRILLAVAVAIVLTACPDEVKQIDDARKRDADAGALAHLHAAGIAPVADRPLDARKLPAQSLVCVGRHGRTVDHPAVAHEADLDHRAAQIDDGSEHDS